MCAFNEFDKLKQVMSFLRGTQIYLQLRNYMK